MDIEIKRDYYLRQLIQRQNNGLIKVITGIRRCGKSFLLRTLFEKYLVANGVDEDHIIEMAFDLFDNIDYRDPKVFYPWALERLRDEGQYYFLLDEVQMLGEFVSVLNGLDDKKKFYIGTPVKYYFMDLGLRNARINYRQMQVTHSMENVIYNEMRMRGFSVDVGNLNIVEKGKDGILFMNVFDFLLKPELLEF